MRCRKSLKSLCEGVRRRIRESSYSHSSLSFILASGIPEQFSTVRQIGLCASMKKEGRWLEATVGRRLNPQTRGSVFAWAPSQWSVQHFACRMMVVTSGRLLIHVSSQGSQAKPSTEGIRVLLKTAGSHELPFHARDSSVLCRGDVWEPRA